MTNCLIPINKKNNNLKMNFNAMPLTEKEISDQQIAMESY